MKRGNTRSNWTGPPSLFSVLPEISSSPGVGPLLRPASAATHVLSLLSYRLENMKTDLTGSVFGFGQIRSDSNRTGQ
ncbi:hypothetical protein TorRG33x02_170680 [Trema orientale]|uniref:Uncharacterized protein n=1 Tax=Trema orientale TaxID=63057 RepID=A0A2P5ENN5_TREOI|nr:hypothetical protein TorRG33x02_170680 [Trema orientale]